MFGFGIWELLVVLAIVVLIFGPKRLKTLGSDLGGAIKGFRTAIKDESGEKVTDSIDSKAEAENQSADQNTKA